MNSGILPNSAANKYILLELGKSNPKNIHIVGGPGSGKSYLAARLSKELETDHYGLDDIFWDHRIKGDGK